MLGPMKKTLLALAAVCLVGLCVSLAVAAQAAPRAVDMLGQVTRGAGYQYAYLPGGTNATASPAASASAACTGLTAGANYYITCDQNFRFRQGTGTPTATASDFGPIAANTILHGRLGATQTAIAFYNLGGAGANCSCSPEATQ